MKKITIISAMTILFVGLLVVSCQLLLSSEERKLVGIWHESLQQDIEDSGLTVRVESESTYKEDRTSSSSSKCTYQFNLAEEGYHYIVYASFNMNATGTWKIDGDNLIEKQNEVQYSPVTISSREELTEEYKRELKNTMEKEILPQVRDEMLKKDTTEIVYLSEKEYKYKTSDGEVYTMVRIK